uniref:Uncharacterized protein n=1 Tax=Arundo donax TaxID=35708 RepID=A0A0A9H322_ARUDO
MCKLYSLRLSLKRSLDCYG